MRNRRRSGVTLLELILALALTVILLGAIAMAIRLNLRTLDSRRSSVEEVQLARAVLRMISEDIRSAVQYEAQDFSAIEEMMDNAVASQANALGGLAGVVPGAAAPSVPGGPAAGGSPGSIPEGGFVPGGPGTGNGPGARPGGPTGGPGQNNGPNGQSADAASPANGSQVGQGRGGQGRGGPGGGSGGGGGPGNRQGGRRGNSGGGGGGMSMIGIPGGTPVSGGGSGGQTGAGANGAAGSETTPPENIGESVLPTSAPGLFGNQNELQIDVSRLPRLEQYQKMGGGGGAITDVPSDLKTVAYFVRGDGAAPASNGFAPAGTLTSLDNTRPGLFRRELDRAVTQYAMDRGQADQLNQQGELIAPEVVGLEFRYFDGTQWLNQWDSQQASGLPFAVEIVVAIQPGTRWDGVSQGSAPPVSGVNGAAAVPPRLFRQVVRIAAARPAPAEAPAEEEPQ